MTRSDSSTTLWIQRLSTAGCFSGLQSTIIADMRPTPLQTQGRSEWESDRWRLKKKSPLLFMAVDPAHQASARLLSHMHNHESRVAERLGENSLSSVRGRFLQMGIRLRDLDFLVLRPSPPLTSHRRSPLTCRVEGSHPGSSWCQTLTSLALLPRRI